MRCINNKYMKLKLWRKLKGYLTWMKLNIYFTIFNLTTIFNIKMFFVFIQTNCKIDTSILFSWYKQNNWEILNARIFFLQETLSFEAPTSNLISTFLKSPRAWLGNDVVREWVRSVVLYEICMKLFENPSEIQGPIRIFIEY